jgi:hypothetical protein
MEADNQLNLNLSKKSEDYMKKEQMMMQGGILKKPNQILPYISKFFALKEILFHLFLQKDFNLTFPSLKNYEILILKSIILKKFNSKINVDITKELLNSIVKINLKKKKEYCLKMVIMKSITHLKNSFLVNKYNIESKMLLSNEISVKSTENIFYQYYFGDVAKKNNLPIETFYGFKNWTHRHNKNIPKSITNRVISLWKQSPEFISEMRGYIKHQFLTDFEVFNKEKILKMLRSWGKIIKKKGLDEGVQSILKSLSVKGCKLPWTMSEARNAVMVTNQVLNEE